MDASQSVNLEKSVDGNDLYQSHKQVIAYWSPFWDKMETYYDNLAGEMWTPDEKKIFATQRKAPVVINDLKPAERTILGLFIQNKYDVKFAPREEAQDISDVLQKLYAWTAYTQDWAFKDIELVRQAWCGGVAYQEIYVKVVPGKEPVIITQTLNPFSIAWDPESRDLINREDAAFVDRDTWVSYDDLAEMWPDKITTEDELTSQNQQAYTQGKSYADRSTEYWDAKNNRYKVTERYYKVRKVKWKATDGQTSIDIQDPQNRQKYEQEGYQLHRDTEEMLYLAIVCPAWKNGEYLYNGPYHCQPRDLFTGKVIFPILELVAESINGVPGGFVQHLVQINRLKNSAVSNMFHAQKHAASTGLLRKKKLFGGNEVAAADFDKNHAAADRVFVAADAADLTTDIGIIPKATVTPDTSNIMDVAQVSFQSISSTPPALQGQVENAGDSGILNSQRIEQSFVQLQVLIANIKHFLKRRAELVYYYWREYFTYPMKVRIVGGKATQGGAAGKEASPGQPPQTHVSINEEAPATDWQGRPTGAIEKINDIAAARYDVDIEDSYQSPTYRAKRMQELSEIMQKASNIDPNLLEALFVEYANSTDMAQATKDIINNASKAKQEQASQPPPPPPPKPASLSFSFKGEDFNNPWVQQIVAQSGVISQEAAQGLQGAPIPPPVGSQSTPETPDPLAAQKQAADVELQAAKTEGQRLDNTRKTQEIADNEAAINAAIPTESGLVPSVDESFQRRPTAFAPMGPR